MKEDFQTIKDAVSIRDAANALGLKPDVQGRCYFPGEKTASIKLYMQTGTFYDFGRSVGGDVVRLWAHIKGCDSWRALQEIRTVFGIENGTRPDRKELQRRIHEQEEADAIRKAEEARKKREWVAEVDTLKAAVTHNEELLSKAEPLSDQWAALINETQILNYRLDCLCGLCDDGGCA